MNAILFSVATFVSTGIGGLFALKFRDRLHFLLSFTAGVLLGVVCFEVLPEVFSLAHKQQLDVNLAMIALVVGFLVFHGLEKYVLIHHAHEEDYARHRHPKIGDLSALSLAAHSFMDGVGIGLGFQVSESVGIVVAIAVISHDFCDGMNTVGLMLVNHNTNRRALVMLLLDAIAPVLGVVSTLLFQVPPSVVLVYLGFFAGFLLYISASDILPEAHSQNRPSITLSLIGLTCLGALSIYVISRVV